MHDVPSKSDVTILGGGLAGLSLALQLNQKLPKSKLVILEKRKHPVPEAAHKVGESTVEVAAHYFGEILGLKQHIKDEQLPKLGLRFFFPNGDNSRIEERLELGGKRYASCPSYQLDRGRFENHLGDLCRERGIEFIDEAKIKDVTINKRGGHCVDFEIQRQPGQIQSRWVVDASGRRAFLKRKLGLQKPSPHTANAAWFRFGQHIKVDDWCDQPAWSEGHQEKTARWYSTNHLMGKGYWVWLIPLASGSTSMGIVAAEEFHSLSEFNSFDKALAWLEKHEPQCAAAVREHVDDLQDFRAIKHYSTECEQVFSANRWGITGEAGFFHDPFYSPGSDFIAFANTFLTDLIWRDLTWRGYRVRAYSYDKIYKRFYYGTLSAYQEQYEMFGNPIVMPTKILWDYLVYWSITGFIYFHERMCHQTMYMRNLGRLKELSKINHFMQNFFRQWHAETDGQTATGYVNTTQMPIIMEMNSRLKEDLSGNKFFERFALNVKQLETLASEIVESSGMPLESPFKPSRLSSIRSDSFESILGSTSIESELGAKPLHPESVSELK
ncbi:MAG: tryptophan 7-halogenase [Mariniblastus sp.]|nr:tryptophan 7-halogenase [Mariniblastus sp.]